MGDSLEATDTSVETQNVAIVDYGEFANYIRKAATILLPEEDATAPALHAVLEDKVNQDCIKKFLSDPQIQALYIQRTCSKGKPSVIAYVPLSISVFFSLFARSLRMCANGFNTHTTHQMFFYRRSIGKYGMNIFSRFGFISFSICLNTNMRRWCTPANQLFVWLFFARRWPWCDDVALRMLFFRFTWICCCIF